MDENKNILGELKLGTNKKNNNIPSNEDMYAKLCELTEKYNLLEKDNEKNKKNILVLNRQLLILKTFIDDYIIKFSQDMDIKVNGMNNNFNKENLNDDLLINHKKAEEKVEQKFGELKYKETVNFEKLLKKILDTQKDIIEEENLKEFKKLSHNLIEHQISPAIIISNFFREEVFNKIYEKKDNIDIENVKRFSLLQMEMVNAANNIEFQLNTFNPRFHKKEKKDEKKDEKKEGIKENKKEEKKAAKKVDIVAEFRNEFDITNDYASDKEIKKLLKENQNDKLKTYNIILYKVLHKK